MGFDPSWFSGVVTSGEVTHQMLASRGTGSTGDGEESDSDDEFWASLGKKCVHFTWSSRGGAIPLDGLDLETVTDPEEADFLLAHGTEAVNGAGTDDEQRAAGCVNTSLEDMREVLERAHRETCPHRRQPRRYRGRDGLRRGPRPPGTPKMTNHALLV